MRVVCVHPTRDTVHCDAGTVRIGSAPDNDIVLVDPGVDPHHAELIADARGLLLRVQPQSRRVYVNARAVREAALLRYGDYLTLGANKFLLAADAAPAEIRDPGESIAFGLAGLRIMSGAASGLLLPIAPELWLGSGSRHFAELPYTCRVAQTPDGLIFESESNLPRINGWHCRCVRLSPNDLIVLGEHRLLVEASLPHGDDAVAESPHATVTDQEPGDASHAEIWWLIGAALVLAVLIALFLYFRW